MPSGIKKPKDGLEMTEEEALEKINHDLERLLLLEDPSEYTPSGLWVIWVLETLKMMLEKRNSKP